MIIIKVSFSDRIFSVSLALFMLLLNSGFRCQKGNIAGEEDSGRQSDEAHLRELEVFDPEKGRLKAGLIILCNYLTRRCSQVRVWLFSQLTSEGTRGNGLELHQGRFSSDIRKNCLTERADRH